ncbi:NlpC/P60 family protein [Kitasatospora sp. NPDC006697]|uniref:C40 family peptidase n=1 Tax=Kitasatospora sp. NPDC006697 TaxID=3364020 RepID=UPI0036B34B02
MLILPLAVGGPAWAHPDDDPPPPAPSATAATSTATATVQPPSGPEAPPATAELLSRTDGVAALLVRLQELRHQAEQAAQESTARDAELAARQAEVDRTDGQIAAQQQQVDASEGEAARLAGEQYRDGGLSGITRFLFSLTPTGLLSEAGDLQERSRSESDVVRELRAGRSRLAALGDTARQARVQAQLAADRARTARDAAQREASGIEAQLTALTDAQRSQLDQREGALADLAEQRLVASGLLGTGGGPATPAAATAVGYAMAQLGKPYLWGGTGPDAYDCSGLTSKAWEAAGVPMPRTSQEQWASLPRVPLDALRPGDLIIYFPDATHVGLYLGNGLMVNAPHTGAVIRVAPVAAMPVLGAVRPKA